MQRDGLYVGVDYGKLGDEIDLVTVGGATPTFLEPAEISFTDLDARTAFSYRVMLAIAPPSSDTAAVPSLLGRDVINRWRIDYHLHRGTAVVRRDDCRRHRRPRRALNDGHACTPAPSRLIMQLEL
jgi:hypothetical protein